MPQFTLNDLANNAGQATANAGINLAKEAKGLACSLYKNYTGWATKLDLPNPPPAAFIHGVWDTVCADDPGGLPAPPPSPDFTGGQCPCVGYQVNVRFSWAEYPQYSNLGGGQAVGPIQGLVVKGPENHPQLFVIGGDCSSGQLSGTKLYGHYSPGENTGVHFGSYKIESMYRLDGQPDSCGNPPSGGYPYVVPPPAALNKNVTINLNDGTDITVPLAFAQMNNNLDITVDVGGVGFNFNVDGVGFNFNQNSQNNYINFPGGGSGGGSGSGGGGAGGDNNFTLNNKLDNITNKIDNKVDIKLDDVILDINLVKDKLDSPNDCCPEPPDPDTQTAIVCPIDDGNTYTGIKDLVSVKLDVTKLPLSSKIQFGNGSPNVLFAGWLAFTFEGQAYEREPIHFQHNLFTPPKGANGFFYCLTNGAKGRVTYYVKT